MHRNGTLFDAEIGVSKVRLDQRDVYIVCLRETTDRKAAEAAIRESEARYRTLVENAPEAIVVLDMDTNRFVECNENAVRFFKMTRDELLAISPDKLSPPLQPDGTPSLDIVRGHLDRALAGEAPIFEWLHRDALGHDIPCEVRMVRLPSSGRRLIRGSIIDITERKRMELLATGERRVFERITGHADLTADARSDHRDGRESHDRRDLHDLAARCRCECPAARGRKPAAGRVPRIDPTAGSGPAQGLLRRRRLPATAGPRRRDRA